MSRGIVKAESAVCSETTLAAAASSWRQKTAIMVVTLAAGAQVVIIATMATTPRMPVRCSASNSNSGNTTSLYIVEIQTAALFSTIRGYEWAMRQPITIMPRGVFSGEKASTTASTAAGREVEVKNSKVPTNVERTPGFRKAFFSGSFHPPTLLISA